MASTNSIEARDVGFDDVFITRELAQRPAPTGNHEQIKTGIQLLARRMIDGPETVLPLFVRLAMELGKGVSAGVSVFEPQANPPGFRWAFLQGSLSAFEGATTPRDYSPCGVTLDVDGPVLTRHSERIYSWISDANMIIPEVLLVPLHRGSEQLGTLWIVADRTPHFDRGQVAAISELADFGSVALQMLPTEARLKSVADRHEALAQEMSHRVKNAFAIIQGLIHLTARTAKTKDELAASLSGRVGAMGEAHALVRRSLDDGIGPQKNTDLDALLRAILRPHEAPEGEPQRFCLNGPTVSLGGHATNNLALVLHELATNAAKYGALSNQEGRVEIEWTLDDATLTLQWREVGGPPVASAPRSTGFGMRLIKGSAESLAGKIHADWRREGVAVSIEVPVAQLPL